MEHQITDEVVRQYMESAVNHMETDPDKLHAITVCNMLKLSSLNMLHTFVKEICNCFYLQNVFAATTLTNHLFECMVKFTLAFIEGGGKKVFGIADFGNIFEKEFALYGEEDLGRNIKTLYDKHIISKELRGRLLYLKNKYRNPYSHASNNNYVKKATTTIYAADINKPTEMENRIVNVTGNPFLLIDARKAFLQRHALPYFVEICKYLRYFDEEIGKLYKS